MSTKCVSFAVFAPLLVALFGVSATAHAGLDPASAVARSGVQGIVGARLETRRLWPPALRRIVIDPGHGGSNEGALGIGEIHEKHLTLPIAMHLADRLRQEYPDVEVVLTRSSDLDLGLSERIEVANALDADLFISVHMNAAPNPNAVGFETYWVADLSPTISLEHGFLQGFLEILPDLPQRCAQRREAAERAREFAELVQSALSTRFDSTNRGVKRGNYTVLRRANVPAVVIELGFLTHSEEGLSVIEPNRQALYVDALLDAIEGFDEELAADRHQAIAMQ